MRKRLWSIAFLVAVVLLFAAFETSGTGSNSVVGQNLLSSASGESEEEVTEDVGYYIIMEIDSEEQTIRFYNPSLERLQIYSYDSNTYYYDDFGGLKSLAQFSPGDVVGLTLQSGKYTIATMQDSAESWEYTGVSEYTIHTETEGEYYIRFNDRNYRLSDYVTVFEDGTQSALKSVGASDILTIRGTGNRADVILVESRTGYVQFVGTEHYTGGYYTVGNFLTGPITSEGQVIAVKAGTHLFAAANNGYGGSEEITVVSGELTQIDLTQIDTTGNRTCTLTITINPDWAQLYIDGVNTDYSDSFPLSYGTHTLKIVASGYETYTRLLIVNSAKARLDFDVTATSSGDATTTTSDTTDTEDETDTTDTTSHLSTTTTDTDDVVSTISGLLDGTSTDSTSTYSILSSLLD